LKIEFKKIKMAYVLLKNLKGYHIHFLLSSNSPIDEFYDGYTVYPVVVATTHSTVCLRIRKSRISWYQNRPKDFSSSCFFIDDAQLRGSSSCSTPNSFFIGAHGQELSVPRNSTLIMMPRNTGIGSLS
jgi:hypothetical protein